MGLALVIVPFLSASNMFFRVGFVLAERVLYIPRLAPEHVSSHNNLGTMLGLEEAEYHLREAVKHNPQHSRAHYNLGNLLSGSGRQEEALLSLRESLRLNDAFPDAWSAYGGVLLKVGRRGEALTALNKMMELRTSNPDLYCNVATYFEDLGMYDKAIVAAKEAVLLHSEHAQALRIMGHSYRQLRENEKAEDSYLRSVKSRADPHTMYLLSALYYNTGNFHKAAETASRLVTIDPSHVDGTMTYALSLLEVGRTQEAKEVLESATRQFPDSPSPYKHMALLLSKQKRYKEAEKYAKRAMALNGRDTSLLTMLGNIHKELKQYTKSKQVCIHICIV
jgi:tetratricopeptide (TPR) repeat protein